MQRKRHNAGLQLFVSPALLPCTTVGSLMTKAFDRQKEKNEAEGKCGSVGVLENEIVKSVRDRGTETEYDDMHQAAT